MRFLLPSVAVVLLCPSELLSQGAIVPDPEGVYLDPDGVLRTRPTEAGERLRALRRAARDRREGESWAYVSLPRLFREVRERVEAGQLLSDEMRLLSGMVKLRYVFVYPEEGDLVLAGPAEPVVADFPGRPVGERTGRPVLQLDDLVVALRTCGPGVEGGAFGCTIQLQQEALERMLQTMRDNAAAIRNGPDRRREVADQMAEAAGLQPVAVFNLAENTRFAMVAIEADYLMKRHALGLDRTPVRQARSYLDRLTGVGAMSHRFWFELSYEPLLATPEGDAFEIRGQSLQVCTRRSFHEEDPEPSPAAEGYGRDATRHFPQLAEHLLPFADLANLADLALVAALLSSERLPERVGWDLEWVLAQYPVARVETPSRAAALANYRVASNTVLYAGGGVRFTPADYVGHREVDESGAVRARASRPEEGAWFRVGP